MRWFLELWFTWHVILPKQVVVKNWKIKNHGGIIVPDESRKHEWIMQFFLRVSWEKNEIETVQKTLGSLFFEVERRLTIIFSLWCMYDVCILIFLFLSLWIIMVIVRELFLKKIKEIRMICKNKFIM